MTATAILINMAGAVALMIWAVRMVRTGITRALGGKLHSLIQQAAGQRILAFGNGLLATLMVQSSVAVAMIVSSLAGRGAIALVPGLAVLLGADVGSTLVVQIVAFDINWLSPLCILIGVVSFMGAKGGVRRHIGRFIIGIGLLLLSLSLLKEASQPLRESPALLDLMAALGGAPIIAVFFAALLAWLAHSSLAVILLIISLCVAGVIELLPAMALVLGANIGSALVPAMATLGALPQARRVPLGNLAMRSIGALALLPLLDHVLPLLSPFDGDAARQLALFHTGFNLALAVLFLPILSLVASVLEKFLPDPDGADDPSQPRFLDEDAISDPAAALANASREAMRMADAAETMIVQARDFLFSGDDRLLPRVASGEKVLDQLHRSIKLYLIKLQGEGLDSNEGGRQMEIMSLVTNLEHLGDIIDHNLIDAGRKRRRLQITFTAAERQEIELVYGLVEQDMKLAANVFMTRDIELAKRLVDHKSQMREIEQRAGENHLQRLSENGGPTASLHLDIIRDLKRLHSHIASMAYPLLEAEGILAGSRLISNPGKPAVQ